MSASAYPETPARSLEDFASLDGVRRWLLDRQGRSAPGALPTGR